MRHLPSSLSLLALLLLPAIALAGPPDIQAPLPEPRVWNGTDTMPCGWPSVVMVVGNGALCSATLIHPQVVMFAAHCGDVDKVVRFGDSDNSAKTRQVEHCKVNPAYSGNQSNDWGYCVLAEPVYEIPFTPVGFGCELQQYYHNGAEIAIIGFGNNSGDTGAGRKRWGFTNISNASSTKFDVGGNGTETICSGDSGGPAMIRYDDGSWHVFGIASTKYDNTCTSAKGTHSVAANAVKWIEQDSGIDVTVCHDINGNWDPGPLCGNFFNGQPALGYGSWNEWCPDATALEWSATCGTDFYSQNYEQNAPSVEVVVPFDGQVFDTEPAMFDITVNASDDSGLPVQVEIDIDGMLVNQVVDTNPAVFANATFYCGEYTITAHGTDFWGNLAHSQPVTFTVAGACNSSGDGDGAPGDGDGDGAPGDGDGDSGGNTDTSGGVPSGTGDTSGGPGLDPSVDDGCSCAVDERDAGGPLALLLSVFGLGLVRRRR